MVMKTQVFKKDQFNYVVVMVARSSGGVLNGTALGKINLHGENTLLVKRLKHTQGKRWWSRTKFYSPPQDQLNRKFWNNLTSIKTKIAHGIPIHHQENRNKLLQEKGLISKNSYNCQ